MDSFALKSSMKSIHGYLWLIQSRINVDQKYPWILLINQNKENYDHKNQKYPWILLIQYDADFSALVIAVRNVDT